MPTHIHVRYKIHVVPSVSFKSGIEKPFFATIFARRVDEEERKWSVHESQLTDSLAKLMGKRVAGDILETLRAGKTVNLPGVYSPTELILLGFRKIAKS